MSDAAGGYGPRVNVVDLLATPARQHSTLDVTEHRPWPLPDAGRWLMGQTWDDLLFAHWAVPLESVQAHVPPALPVDTFDGTAWVGVTPFRVGGLRLRGTLPPPVVSTFPELNVRTYVTIDGKPGIWFFSLDADSRLAVEAARRTYRLPYFHARMTAQRAPDGVRYRSERRSRAERPARFAARYGPAGETFTAEHGTLEHFLTERYCLYTVYGRDVYRAEIHHPPWPLQPAEAAIDENTMPPPGLDLGGEPLFHFAVRQDVVVWPLARCG